jgi:hypothetical protein
VLGVYWGDLTARGSLTPTDGRGALRCVVDQGPSIVGHKKPPVFAQLCVALDAAPGPSPPGWLPLGVQDDASNNVPSELRYRTAPAWGPQSVTWTWTDPKVNVAAAVITALR